ncbi:MAG: cytochrome c biogenesis protein CcsA [Burkholderiales bacterium]|nr:cytochrome c biogenesis protein CcsA [Opitutaceae bacterium]
MKKLLPLLALLLGLLYIGSTLRAPRAPADAPDHVAFGRLPVLVGGRIKPLDTVARATLLQFQGRQNVRLADGTKLTPSQWIADALLDGKKADAYQVFEIVHPDLLALLKLSEADGAGKKRFSYTQLSPGLAELERQAQLAQPVEAQRRTPFQRAVIALRDNIGLYVRLQASLVPPEIDDPLVTLTDLQKNLPVGIAAIRLRQQNQPHNEQAATNLLDLASRFEFMAQNGYLLAVPPADENPDDTAWRNNGAALLDTFSTGAIEAHAYSYAGLAYAWRGQKADEFDTIVRLLRAELDKRFSAQLAKVDAETRFKAAAPFYSGMNIFVAALLLAVFSWLKWPDTLGRAAYYLLALGFVLMTAGIATRMWLEGRPPVTNLYSSALFVAWGSVGLCLILEKIHPRGLASAVGGIIGFSGLIIAHHLSLSGDTLEMMRAVLDSNFWLATHVVIITIGYSATYLAGFLAALYIIRGCFTGSLDRDTSVALERMVYGILCFATLFSLVGTILGGIWADQSWGRFWGWDPKENGALIIVLWNALILHVRWGKLGGARALMALAVFGNVVTSWSWFGTNLLGVGLHSYGFTDRGFWALLFFGVSQLALIALAVLPGLPWRSREASLLGAPASSRQV